MLRSILRIVAVSSFALCMSGCGQPAEKMADVDPLGWFPSEPAEIMFENTDTAGLRNISILFVSNDDFEQRGQSFRIKVTSPDGRYYIEDFDLRPDPDRIRRGGFSELVVPYRDNAVLGLTGRYVFKITPLEELEGVAAVGIKIE